jgi:hypothetical protein
MFRNLIEVRSSDLIREAVAVTAREWVRRYGELPEETLQTEVKPDRVSSEIPGYCYRRAGWVKFKESRGMIYLRCPRPQLLRALENQETAAPGSLVPNELFRKSAVALAKRVHE